ncbi:S8 family peptidase [Actinophytocola gossypii]|uniref:S8 family serine peptidase n=1 Tax=Actinophytocola gossypii TaxID=2812003 RepID=A0ABT2J5B5_9PSEU|nr:S8 family serine peptidase [Actinophytocola gossypii]MCT2583056.1 S8 family serine peptidase [Actinophytocola gossypii]
MKRKSLAALLAVPLFAGVIAVAPAAAEPAAQPALSGKTVEYNVLAADGVSVKQAERAVRAAGGKVVRSNAAVGLITATAPESGFTARLADDDEVLYTARKALVGKSPKARKQRADDSVVEKENAQGARKAPAREPERSTAGMDPLDSQLWGLTSVRSDLARTEQAGNKKVKVGVLDTGVDGSHPDIAPNFDAALSRNFTRDIPTDELGQVVDGPCEFRGCVDPANWDDGGHGTHVAGTIAAAANGMGVSGVAPNVSIVNIRGGQDSGYFFLQPVVDAITYSGDAGLDVVNMSFYVDPWRYNCLDNPADTPEQTAQQRTVITAMTRAMNYAHRKGVTQIVSLGNGHEDTGKPQDDTGSPNFPGGISHPREIDNATCKSMPVDGPNAITVSAFGPSQVKADYSSYGTELISVSAPGGYFRDYFGTPWYRTNENLILSTYPKNVALAEGAIDEDGNVTPHGEALGVQKDCSAAGECGYYQFLQGTSMASPHASGVAALIVSEYGKYKRGSVSMKPAKVRSVLEGTAFEIPCPSPRTIDYLDEGRDATYTATCEGDLEYNGFYGNGAVDAWAAVTQGRQYLR